MISFKARYIDYAQVKKFDANRVPRDYRAQFVELDPDNISDMKALKTVSEEWDFGETFAKNIYNEARGFLRDWGEHPQKRFFAVVRGCSDLRNLNPYNIMGITQVNDSFDRVEIKYLQVEPPYTEYQLEPRFKYVGSSILESIKKIIPDKNIILRSVDSARRFYKKNGFESMRRENWMILKR